MKKIALNISIIIALIISFYSCQSVIDIDLNETNPKLVVEGNVHTDAGPYEVKLSRTVNFDEANEYPPVSGATVIIADDMGTVDTLVETNAGTYETTTIQGLQNHTYFLTIIDGTDTITSSSTIPLQVNLDSLSYVPFAGFLNPTHLTVPHYTDPQFAENYYRFRVFKNGKRKKAIYVLDDVGVDGQTNIRPIFTTNIDVGDTVEVEMQCVDKAVYDYYYSWSQLSNSPLNQSATPSNPISNIQGANALGYFNAHTRQRLTIIIQ